MRKLIPLLLACLLLAGCKKTSNQEPDNKIDTIQVKPEIVDSILVDTITNVAPEIPIYDTLVKDPIRTKAEKDALFKQQTKKINGGYNGLEDRQKRRDYIEKVLKKELRQ